MALIFQQFKYSLSPHLIDPYSIINGVIASSYTVDADTMGFVLDNKGIVEVDYSPSTDTLVTLNAIRIYTPEKVLGMSATGFSGLAIPIKPTGDDLDAVFKLGFQELVLTDTDDVYTPVVTTDTTADTLKAYSVDAQGGTDVAKFEDSYFASNYTLTKIDDSKFQLAKAGVTTTYSNFEAVEFNDTGRLTVDELLTKQPGASVDEVNGIARLYLAAFDRLPDISGLNNWVKVLEQGQSAPQIALSFSQAQEFKIKYGETDNEAFVTQLYQNVLDRAPDTAGLSGWVSNLNQGVSRGDILVSFADSSENKANADNYFKNMAQKSGNWEYTFEAVQADVQTLARLYKSAFDRDPDVSGLNVWVKHFEEGMSVKSIANAFYNSAEFTALYGNPSNTEYVNLLYKNVLHRAPDTDGLDNNVRALEVLNRTDMLVSFSNSAESINNTKIQFAGINEVNDVWQGF